MRKITIILTLQLFVITAYSQTLNLTQQNSIFNDWMLTKGKSISTITKQLKGINSGWSLKSEKPEVDRYTKSYYWTAPTEMGELQYFILTVEEDEESYKFSVRYLFYHLGEFTKMVAEMRDKSKVGEFSEQRELGSQKQIYSVVVLKPDLDYFLTEKNLQNEAGKTNTAFTIDITSKYINK